MATLTTGKKIWHSKTLWVNTLALVALAAQHYLGFSLSAEAQVSILAGINTLLRLITKDELVWG